MRVKCKICKESFDGNTELATHLKDVHKMDVIKYYDKYTTIRRSNKCRTCGKKTEFMGLDVGFAPYCSIKCLKDGK